MIDTIAQTIHSLPQDKEEIPNILLHSADPYISLAL